jgi:hypothetical protein
VRVSPRLRDAGKVRIDRDSTVLEAHDLGAHKTWSVLGPSYRAQREAPHGDSMAAPDPSNLIKCKKLGFSSHSSNIPAGSRDTVTSRRQLTSFVVNYSAHALHLLDDPFNRTQNQVASLRIGHQQDFCAIATRRMARSSAAGSKQWASRRSSRRHDHLGRTPMSSGVIGSIRRECLDHIVIFKRAPSAPRPVLVCRILSTHPDPRFARQGLPRSSPDSASQRRKNGLHPKSRWLASSLRTPRSLIRA